MKLPALTTAIAIALTTPLFAQAQPPGADTAKPPKNPPPSAEAKRALDDAKTKVAQLKGVRGPARLQGLAAAAAAYEAVAQQFGTEPHVVATACFEAGEIWRRHQSLDKAVVCYTRALEHDDGRYAQRCWFELGQVQRRQKDYAAALESYGEAASISPGSRRAHDARVWTGRTFEAQGDVDAAIAAFRTAVTSTDNPRWAIDACNDLAKTLIKQGDLDGAAAAITQAETRAQPALTGPSSASVKKALESMSARKALQRARDKANGAAKDAMHLERMRKRK